MKRTPIQRKTPLKAKSGLKRSAPRKKGKNGAQSRTRAHRAPSIKTLRNKCDKLLTPIIKSKHPNCLLCNNETEVAHHHINKSQSNALRYDLENLINLCHGCHQRLHNNESYWASVIVRKKGMDWFNRLEQRKNTLVKANKGWYQEHYERLKNIYEEVQDM